MFSRLNAKVIKVINVSNVLGKEQLQHACGGGELCCLEYTWRGDYCYDLIERVLNLIKYYYKKASFMFCLRV